MDHRSAEIGKLAHNVYIATKFSFTNEIENICSEVGGNPEKVMSVIWADRKVKSKVHLIPNKGLYSGSCVPKDRHELIPASSKSLLFKAVEEVKNNYMEVKGKKVSIVTIIPTKNRPEKLYKALHSVSFQEKQPERVLIISESTPDNYEKETVIVGGFSDSLDVSIYRNTRSENLSGAINTALIRFLSEGFSPEDTYISILDDDDTWNQKYLKSCYHKVMETGSDWIISGIMRFESIGQGVPMNLPREITTDVFFAGNPNIQGSNLFIRFSRMLEAGSFDEKMVSTTDRDMCIRLTMLPSISYEIIDEHMVNHYALDDPSRLSSPKTRQKREGLEYFYHKYSPLMSSEIEERFLSRCKNLFGIEISDSIQDKTINRLDRYEGQRQEFDIIIGFSAKRSDSTNMLLSDLRNITIKGCKFTRVLIIDDLNDGTKSLLSIAAGYESVLPIKVITRKEIEEKYARNSFGFDTVCCDGQGISSIRTALQHYLYWEAQGLSNPAIWILDDDDRLEFFDNERNIKRINPDTLIADFSFLKNNGFDFAVGPITGDPPIPAMSIVRTQLLDLFYNLIKDERRPTRLNRYRVESDPDYYYDYSDLHYTHLENPLWTNEVSKSDLIEMFLGISHGKSTTRPCFLNDQISAYVEHGFPLIRGGNSVVFNPDCLRLFHTISPMTNNIRWKRGDSMWSLFSMLSGGFKVGKMITGVRHERTESNGAILSETVLLSDFWGSSLIKALHEFYKTTGRNGCSFSSSDVEWIIKKFDEFLEHRLSIFTFNAYRIRGLSRMLRNVSYPMPDSLQHIMDNIDLKYSTENSKRIVRDARNVEYGKLKLFLKNYNNIFEEL